MKFPYIWQRRLDWVQYDGSIMQPMVRNAGEAMGVAAKVNTTNPARPLYASSVDVNSLFEMESSLAGPNPLGKEGKPAFKGLASPKVAGGSVGRPQARAGEPRARAVSGTVRRLPPAALQRPVG